MSTSAGSCILKWSKWLLRIRKDCKGALMCYWTLDVWHGMHALAQTPPVCRGHATQIGSYEHSWGGCRRVGQALACANQICSSAAQNGASLSNSTSPTLLQKYQKEKKHFWSYTHGPRLSTFGSNQSVTQCAIWTFPLMCWVLEWCTVLLRRNLTYVCKRLASLIT